MSLKATANSWHKPLEVILLYNEPSLEATDPDWASEAGVLESLAAVEAALRALGHRPRRLGLAEPVSTAVAQLPRFGPADVVFNLFEGFGGVGRGEAEITGLVELLGYPATGSPAECLALVRDKARTKWLLAGAGLPTPEFRLIADDDPLDEHDLGPLLARGAVIVKPAHEDASLGIGPDSIVSKQASLARQIERVRSRYGPVLVEQFIVGREFNAAVVALGEPELLPLAEIEFSGDARPGWQIVTYEAKWAAGSFADRSTPPRCPARVDAATAERIGQLALAAFRLTGCRDYARIDMRMDAEGRVYVLEVNGNPDIGPSGGFARALGVGGFTFEEFVDRLVRNVFATRGTRATATRSADPVPPPLAGEGA
jgi:D-alanine-D-alanine ligase